MVFEKKILLCETDAGTLVKEGRDELIVTKLAMKTIFFDNDLFFNEEGGACANESLSMKKLPSNPVILWRELCDKPKWLPLTFRCRVGMLTGPIRPRLVPTI